MAFLVCFCFCLQPLEEKMADVRPELAYQVGWFLGCATVCRSSRCRSCSPTGAGSRSAEHRFLLAGPALQGHQLPCCSG